MRDIKKDNDGNDIDPTVCREPRYHMDAHGIKDSWANRYISTDEPMKSGHQCTLYVPSRCDIITNKDSS